MEQLFNKNKCVAPIDLNKLTNLSKMKEMYGAQPDEESDDCELEIDFGGNKETKLIIPEHNKKTSKTTFVQR